MADGVVTGPGRNPDCNGIAGPPAARKGICPPALGWNTPDPLLVAGRLPEISRFPLIQLRLNVPPHGQQRISPYRSIAGNLRLEILGRGAHGLESFAKVRMRAQRIRLGQLLEGNCPRRPDYITQQIRQITIIFKLIHRHHDIAFRAGMPNVRQGQLVNATVARYGK